MYCIFIHVFSLKLNISLFVKLGTELNNHLSSQEVDIYYFPVESGHPLFSSQEVDIHYFITRQLVDIHFVSIRKWTSIIFQQKMDINYFPVRKWTSIIFQEEIDIHFFQLGSGNTLFSSQEVDIHYFRVGSGHPFTFQLGTGHPFFTIAARKGTSIILIQEVVNGHTSFFSQELVIYFLFSQESNIPNMLDKNGFL